MRSIPYLKSVGTGSRQTLKIKRLGGRSERRWIVFGYWSLSLSPYPVSLPQQKSNQGDEERFTGFYLYNRDLATHSTKAKLHYTGVYSLVSQKVSISLDQIPLFNSRDWWAPSPSSTSRKWTLSTTFVLNQWIDELNGECLLTLFVYLLFTYFVYKV